MTTLLPIAIVVRWGAWIPATQARRGVPQRTRTLCAAAGNLAFAAGAFIGGQWPPDNGMARVLAAHRRRRRVGRGQHLRFSRFAAHRTCASRRFVDATQHRHCVRVGSRIVRAALRTARRTPGAARRRSGTGRSWPARRRAIPGGRGPRGVRQRERRGRREQSGRGGGTPPSLPRVSSSARATSLCSPWSPGWEPGPASPSPSSAWSSTPRSGSGCSRCRSQAPGRLIVC